MTNKEVFEIIVGNLCTPGMLLSKKHSDIFGIPKKAFYNLKDKENPLAESCIDTIENIYSQIMGYDKEVLETEYELRDSRKRDKDSEYTVPGDLYHKIKNNVMPALGIKEFSHNALLTIIEKILKNIENNRVNLSKALYEIGKDCPNTVFNEYGENRIKQWRYDQKLNCLISSELPEYVGDIRENLKNKIDNKIFEQDYAVISGEAGAGKYSLAVEYAKKNKDKYEYIVIVKWNKSFNDTILNIATQDDFIYCEATEPEKYGEKLKRKKEIIRNCSNVLLIIYDVDKSVESDEISRLCEDLGINIIITTNLRCRGINAEKLSYNEIIAITKYYKKDWDEVANRVDINRLCEISQKNIYIYILLLKWLEIRKFDDTQILNQHTLINPSVKIFDDTEIEMMYHNETIVDTLKGHIIRLMQIDKRTIEEKEELFLLSCFTHRNDRDKTEEIIETDKIEAFPDYFDKEIIEKLKHKKIISYNQKDKYYSMSIIKKLCVLCDDDFFSYLYDYGDSMISNLKLVQLKYIDKISCIDLTKYFLKNIFYIAKNEQYASLVMNIRIALVEKMINIYCDNLILPISLIDRSSNNKYTLKLQYYIIAAFVAIILKEFYEEETSTQFNEMIFLKKNMNETIQLVDLNLSIKINSYDFEKIDKIIGLSYDEGDTDKKRLLLIIKIQKAYILNKEKNFRYYLDLYKWNYGSILYLVLTLLHSGINLNFLEKVYVKFKENYEMLKNYTYNIDKFLVIEMIVAINILRAIVYHEFNYDEVSNYIKHSDCNKVIEYYVYMITVLISINFEDDIISKLINDARKYDDFLNSDIDHLITDYYEKYYNEMMIAEIEQREINKTLNIYNAMIETVKSIPDLEDEIKKCISSIKNMKTDGNVPIDALEETLMKLDDIDFNKCED